MKIFNIKFSLNFDKSGLSTVNFRPFFVGIVAGVIMTIILHVFSYYKLELEQIIKPVTQTVKIADIISPKIKLKRDNFQLQDKTNFFSSSVPIALQSDKKVAYAVVDFNTGEIIAQKNLSKRLAVASLTKIMTAVVALDLSSPDEIFTVSKKASYVQPTTIGVVSGQKMRLDELLKALLLTSANDAAAVIKENIDQKYGKGAFISAMNLKAKYLGLKNTHFDNPQGFDSYKNFSSAEDMALLSHFAYQNYPIIAEITKKDYVFLEANKNHKQFDLYNWNGLLDVYPNVLGLKIGNTDSAGMTSVVLSEREGKKILVVLLGAPTVLDRDLWAANLLNLGFEKAFNIPSVEITTQELQQKYSSWKYWN